MSEIIGTEWLPAYIYIYALSYLGSDHQLRGGGGGYRLRKLACPRVNDDQKIHMDDHKLSSGRPHDYWILERLLYEILCSFFPPFF